MMLQNLKVGHIALQNLQLTHNRDSYLGKMYEDHPQRIFQAGKLRIQFPFHHLTIVHHQNLCRVAQPLTIDLNFSRVSFCSTDCFGRKIF
jgi:hypothetical protein